MNKNELLINLELRESLIDKVEVLDKVKAVPLFPEEMFVGIAQASYYYEVNRDTIAKTINRNKSEFEQDGLRLLSGEELNKLQQRVQLDKIKDQHNDPYIGNMSRSYTVIPKRALLRLGMLLKRSKVAVQVRDYLLNLEGQAKIEDKVKAIKAIEEPSTQLTMFDDSKEEQLVLTPNFAEEKAKADLELLDIATLIKQCSLYGITKTQAALIIQDAKLHDKNVQDEIMKIVEGKKELQDSIKRGRITQRVGYMATRYFDSDFELTWHTLSEELRFEIGVDMRSLRAKYKDKKNAPSYLDLIAKYDAHKTAERVLSRMLKERENQKSLKQKNKAIGK